jgi:hypothetical protein
MIFLISTSLELAGVTLIGIPILHLLFVKLRVRRLQRISARRNAPLVAIIEEAELRSAIWPHFPEICTVVVGLILNIVGLSLRRVSEVIVHFT